MISAHVLHSWLILKWAIFFLDTLVMFGHRLFRVCSPWLRRNTLRCCTLTFGVAAYIEREHWAWYSFFFLWGLFAWNYPKDDDGPPKHRRREQERKEEHLPPNWSGVPENA